MKTIKCHNCGNKTVVYDEYKEEYCCSGLSEGCECRGKPVNPVFCDDCEKEFFGENVESGVEPNGTLENFRKTVEFAQSEARKHLKKQSDYGGYHGGVNNTCQDVLAWIAQLEKGRSNELE